MPGGRVAMATAIERACKALGGKTAREWANTNLGEHCWYDHGGFVACAVCGIVRRKDGPNTMCKGPTRVTTRDDSRATAGE